MYAGMPSLICIAAWPSGKWSDGERRELHRVLEQARAGGEAGARQVGGPRVVLAHGAQHVRVVDARLVGDREELVGDGELHVAPGVREQLGELGLLARGPQRLGGQPPEQRLGPVAGGRGVRADDLGQRVQLLERVALGDPLRAEGDVHVLAAVREGGGDVLGRARIDRAAQDDQRAVAELAGDLVDRPLEHAHRRAEELVDRGADDEQDGVGAADDLGVGAELEAAGREDLAQQLRRRRARGTASRPARCARAWPR